MIQVRSSSAMAIRQRHFVTICIVTWAGTFGTELLAEKQPAGLWPIARLKSEVPAMQIVDDSGRIHSLLYQGEPIDGQPIEAGAPVPSVDRRINGHAFKGALKHELQESV